MRSAFRSMPVRVAIVAVATLAALGALAYAGAQTGSPETSPQELLESVDLEPEEPEGLGGATGEDGFDPAPLREGSEASGRGARRRSTPVRRRSTS